MVVSAPAIDLALLSLDDAAFFDSHPAVPLSDELPAVKSTVNVYGFPLGGEQLSVTEGIISRVEFGAYFLGQHGLRVQIDAALNPGNSGGPAVSAGRLVGVAFSGIPSAENIGYLIPADEVRMFLADVQDGRYDGPPRMLDSLQAVQNEALRAKFGLKGTVGGALVHQPARPGDDYPLKVDDVITHIGEHPLDAAGNVRVGAELQLPFYYYVPKLAHDGLLPLTVLRGGESRTIELPVKYQDKSLLAALNGGYPRYFICGPMVFSPPSKELVGALNEKVRQLLREARSPLVLREFDEPAFAGEELVMLAGPLLTHPIAKGYQSLGVSVLSQVNGTEVKNLKHLVELVRDCQDEFVEFRFAGRLQETLIFRRTELAAATEEILSDNSIRKQCSDDLLPVWTASKPEITQ